MSTWPISGPALEEHITAMSETFWRVCSESDRKLAAQDQASRLRQLRRLDGVSLNHAQREVSRADGRTPTMQVEALMFCLRRGIDELRKPDNLRRVSELSETQLAEVVERTQKFQLAIGTPWTRPEVEALVEIWARVRGRSG